LRAEAAQVKDMRTGEQRAVHFAELPDALAGHELNTTSVE